jgi:hypothetical protein
MSNVEDNETKERKQAKFDLSDGIQAEDFIALGSGLLNLIWKILRVFLYPFIYIWRSLGRLRVFLSVQSARPLTKDEMNFIMSWPLFLSLVGISIGVLLGLIGFLANSSGFWDKLGDFGAFIGFIGEFIVAIITAFVELLKLFWSLLVGLKDFVQNELFASQDFLAPFIFTAIIGFIGAIGILLFLESQIISKFVNKIQEFVSYIFSIPRRIYDYLDKSVWDRLVFRLGKPTVGGEKIENYSNLFFKKVILATFGFSMLFFIFSLFAFANDEHLRSFENTFDSLFVLIFVFLFTGIFTGFPVTYLSMRLLNSVSGNKYSLQTTIEMATEGKVEIAIKATVSTPSSTQPKVAKPKMSAKERAEARRKRRNR